jgi:hypothetical protein
MLPDRISQLLTAYVDGELSSRQRRSVEQLLQQSTEARDLVRQLQEDATRLRGLPRAQLAPEFTAQVLRTIATRRLHHSRRQVQPYRPAVPYWASLAAAACVLLIIGVGSFLYFQAAQRWQVDRRADKKNPAVDPEKDKPVNAAPSPFVAKENEESPKSIVGPEQPADPAIGIVNAENKAPTVPDCPRDDQPKKPGSSTELAVPNPNIKGLEVVKPSLALSLGMRELTQEKKMQQLRKDLLRETAYRLELFCLDNGKALERLQSAFRAQGIRFLIDPEVLMSLKNHKLKGDYALYAEGLTAEELAKVLIHLARDDRQAEAKRRGDGQFDNLLILPMTPADQKELTALLGVDVLQSESPRPKSPLGVDIRKPVSDGTAAQVIGSLEGQGPQRPEPGKPTAKIPERLAVVVPYHPARLRSVVSREVKQFLDGRKEHHGNVQLFLVLRGANG